jgi:cell division protein FtsB
MKLSKQHVGRIFLCGEIIVFAGFYFFGTNGIMPLTHMKREIALLDQQVLELKSDITHLQSTIALQKKHPFFQEKIAREQLQMARAEEEIYLITR